GVGANHPAAVDTTRPAVAFPAFERLVESSRHFRLPGDSLERQAPLVAMPAQLVAEGLPGHQCCSSRERASASHWPLTGSCVNEMRSRLRRRARANAPAPTRRMVMGISQTM